MADKVIWLKDHVWASTRSKGYKSGRNSDREMPVSRSIGKTNSAGTPRLERSSQYQTCDCVVPMRSAKDFWPPATEQARLRASLDIDPPYPFLGHLQPKNLCRTANLDFGRLEPMKEVDPVQYGGRVRARRKALGLSQAKLGKASGYSQTNIGWIEKGTMKRPQASAHQLAQALRTTAEYLLWNEGPAEVGPPIMSGAEVHENYDAFSPEDRAAITALIMERVEAARKKRKTG